MPAERPLRHGREAGFHLIETMRREADGTIPRLELHLARLKASATALDFFCDATEIGSRLQKLKSGGELRRIRLTLEPDGYTEIETTPFLPVGADVVWTVKIASATLPSTDPLLRHKTSRRAVYDKARAEFLRAEADEVLLLNEKGQLCEGTITSLFVRVDDGPLVTPPLDCGLLAGVLRADMIAQGKAREQVVTPKEVFAAQQLFVGNSLRGLVPARLDAKMGA